MVFPMKLLRYSGPTIHLLVCLLLCFRLTAGDVDGLPDFSNLTLQELSETKITSVSKSLQSLSHVAAAVYVISQEDIHRSGMTTVADLLRLAPGLSVARLDGSKWAVSSRGFNGRFAEICGFTVSAIHSLSSNSLGSTPSKASKKRFDARHSWLLLRVTS